MAQINPETKADHVPVVIIGGGIGGLTLGAVLRRLGIRYAILERQSKPTQQGAGISLAPNCQRALDQLGILKKLRDSAQDCLGVKIYRGDKSWGTINFGLCKHWFGYNVQSVERGAFHNELYEAADGEHTMQVGWNVVDIIDDENSPFVIVKGAEGREIHGDIVVGADGLRSVTRRILARHNGQDEVNSIEFTGRVGMSGYTLPLEHLNRKHSGIAHWMLYDDCTLTTWPCVDNRQWFIGVTEANLAPGETHNRSVWKGATTDLVNEAYGDRFHPLGANKRVDSIVNESERVIATYTFSETDFPGMVKGRVALLGDAAHSMVTFFGQGACQAIEDAVELGNALANCYGGKETSALSHYAKVRGERAKQVALFSSNYAKLHTARLPYGMGPLARHVIYKYAPSAAWMWYIRWLYGYQPTIEDHGRIPEKY